MKHKNGRLEQLQAKSSKDFSTAEKFELLSFECDNENFGGGKLFNDNAKQSDLKEVRAQCCWMVGYMYETGTNTPQNDKKAIEYFEKSLRLGDKSTYSSLGRMYYWGKGVKKDYSKAAEYFKMACDAGNGEGCNNLGQMHLFGEGVKLNKSKALEFYKKSCGLGYGKGCYNIGDAYYYGICVEQDSLKAIEFYKKSCDLGYQDFCDIYDRIKKQREQNKEK